MKNWRIWTVVALAAALAVPAATASGKSDDSGLFIRSAVENADDTATFPLYRGTSQGKTVWYIVLDSSNGNDADAKGRQHVARSWSTHAGRPRCSTSRSRTAS